MNDKKFKMIEDDIKIDFSKVPKKNLEVINKIIGELEELEKKEEWLLYDLKYDLLYVEVKSLMLSGYISENDFYKCEKKYGGII